MFIATCQISTCVNAAVTSCHQAPSAKPAWNVAPERLAEPLLDVVEQPLAGSHTPTGAQRQQVRSSHEVRPPVR